MGNMWIRFYIEKKSASMLPEGNGNCFYIEKKGNKKKRLPFFILRMGKRRETHSLRIANKVLRKNIPVCPFSPYCGMLRFWNGGFPQSLLGLHIVYGGADSQK